MTWLEPSAPPERPARSPWLYVSAAPLVLWMTIVLVGDLVLLGRQTESEAPLLAVLVVGLVMTALLVGVWRFSSFRWRTVAMLAGLAFIWGVFLLPPGINLGDIVMDVGLLAAVVVQLIPAGRADR